MNQIDPVKELFLNKYGPIDLYSFQLDNDLFLNRCVDAKVTLMDSKNFNKDTFDMIKNQMYMLHDSVKSCVMCPIGRYLHKTKNVQIDPHVFSNLNYKAEFMIVAQNPGEQECISNKPLVGPSGMNLDKTLEKYNLSRDLFYITNIVKCHTPSNRKPSSDEIFNCSSWINIELKLLKPKVIITLGSPALQYFFPDMNLTSNVNKVLVYKFGSLKFKILPTFHPSPRNLSNVDRKSEFNKTFYIISKLVNKMKGDNNGKEQE